MGLRLTEVKMSETIRKYQHEKTWFKEGRDMTLTALVGGDEYGSCIQFTIGDDFIILTEHQLLDLIAVISHRINHRQGFTATGYTDLKTIIPNGDIIIEEEAEAPTKSLSN